MNLAEFTTAVVQYCMATGGSVTSWIRTPKRNASVGGTPSSRHLTGMAVDVVYDDGLPAPGTTKTIAEKLGLYAYRGPNYSHDHIRPL